jgi:hypothetical protein
VASAGLGHRVLARPWQATWALIERALYKGHPYTFAVPNGVRVFTPWHAPGSTPFGLALAAARDGGEMIVSPDRCYVLHEFALRAARLGGDLAEAGVYWGGTAQLLAETLRRSQSGATLHLFDSFTGMPTYVDADRDWHTPGELAASEAVVRRRLERYSRIEFHVGFVPGTFAELDQRSRFGLVHLDMDLFQSTLDGCKWFWPRVVPGGAMILDDYGAWPHRKAARAAADQYFATLPEKVIALPTGQGIVIKYPG